MPVPGMPTFSVVPRGRMLMLAPRTPTVVEMPLDEMLSLTPGNTFTLRRNRNPTTPVSPLDVALINANHSRLNLCCPKLGYEPVQQTAAVCAG